MAKKRIHIAVMEGRFGSGGNYAKARDETGREVASTYGKDRQDAIAKCVKKVRQCYPDAEVLY